MRKEKFSYVILLAEIVAIIWLHSVKTSDTKHVNTDHLVNIKASVPSLAPEIKYIQAVRR
ncbi:hypothetical protein [Flavitalea sp.]|nr:hypothetical protein [Flavitalea sp.]